MSDVINSGGPAFPVSTRQMEDGTGYGHQDGPHTWQYGGVTVRDYFAAKAMAEMNWHDFDGSARECYKIADAMLRAREVT